MTGILLLAEIACLRVPQPLFYIKNKFYSSSKQHVKSSVVNSNAWAHSTRKAGYFSLFQERLLSFPVFSNLNSSATKNYRSLLPGLHPIPFNHYSAKSCSLLTITTFMPFINITKILQMLRTLNV